MERFIDYYTGPQGIWAIEANDEGITKIRLEEVCSEQTRENQFTKQCIEQLDAYWNAGLRQFDIPLSPAGTPFQQSVWNSLKTIPYGHTWTYKQLAQSIGNLKAIRAVGAANGKNPIPIIIPCHRVIASNGRLQGYALGLELKRQLLDLELRNTNALLF